jgi:hypothetical protein
MFLSIMTDFLDLLQQQVMAQRSASFVLLILKDR